MGGDMIISIVRTKMDIDFARDEMLEAIDRIKKIAQFDKRELSYFYQTLQGGDIPEEINEVKSDIKRVINDFCDCTGHRDVASFKMDGYDVYVTGGMSWGDPPTDSLDVFDNFLAIPNKILKHGRIK